MRLTPSKINTFNLFKLPSVYFLGIRVKSINNESCKVTVKHRWINQNPFNSLFWAVQGMAAELTTGSIIMAKIQESGKQVSMLVTTNKATFTKKATGRITFVCNDGELINNALEKAIETREGQTIWMKSVGTNAYGVKVSTFNFQWSIKVKN